MTTSSHDLKSSSDARFALQVMFSAEGEVRTAPALGLCAGRFCRRADKAATVQDFDTVMKAIASNTERWGIFDVTLELKRYTGATPEGS